MSEWATDSGSKEKALAASRAINDLAAQHTWLCAENSTLRESLEVYRKALHRIAHQELGSWDSEERTLMGATGEPWVHWARIAEQALDEIPA